MHICSVWQTPRINKKHMVIKFIQLHHLMPSILQDSSNNASSGEYLHNCTHRYSIHPWILISVVLWIVQHASGHIDISPTQYSEVQTEILLQKYHQLSCEYHHLILLI